MLRRDCSLQSRGRLAGSTTMMRVIPRRIPMDERVMSKGIHRNAIFSPARLKMSMRQNKLRRIVVVAEVARKCRPTHSDFDVFANLQMQVGIIKAMRRAHGRDLLAAGDRLAGTHDNTV